MTTELIVFDMAGTTVHDNRDVHRVLQQTLSTFQVSITLDEANEVMGIPKPIAIRQLLDAKRAVAATEEEIKTIHAAFIEQMIHFYKHDPSVQEKAGVSDTFRVLKGSKIKIAIDTGFDRKIADAVLDRMRWVEKELIDISVASDEVENGRPYPDMIVKAMAMCGITDSKKVAKVGDTASDLEEGTAAGCGHVIGITSGAFTRAALEKSPHTHLIDTVPEVLNVVGVV